MRWKFGVVLWLMSLVVAYVDGIDDAPEAPTYVLKDNRLEEYHTAKTGQEKADGRNERYRRSVDDNETVPERYDVEITLIVDYSLYKWFYDSETEPHRPNKTIDSVRKYYAHILHGADLRYGHLRREGVDVHLRLKSYIIIQDQTSSFFTENLWVRDGLRSRRRRVNSIKALVALRFWDLSRNLSLLANSDHVMAFTRYNLYKLSSDRKNIKDHGVGIAFAESICTMESYSLIEEKGGFKSEGVAAHEIGHSLGAFYHDGEKHSVASQCSADDLYVMAPVNKLVRHWNRENPYHFSNCSLNQIRTYLANHEKSWCLKDGGERVKDWDSNTAILPGQYMSVHEQCLHRTKNGSQLCGFHRENICQDLWCTVAGKDGGCVTTGPAARGTTCANNKICMKGKCTDHVKAPRADDFCLYGDHPSALLSRPMPCRQYVDAHPGRCYNHALGARCCHSCYQYQVHERPDCSYGDNKRWCSRLPRYRCSDPTIRWHCCRRCTGYRFRCYDNRRFRLHGYTCHSLVAAFGKRQCYNRLVSKHCCKTCRRYRNYMNPNCMFGDRYEFLYRNREHPHGYDCRVVAREPDTYCRLFHVRRDCCETCALY